MLGQLGELALVQAREQKPQPAVLRLVEDARDVTHALAAAEDRLIEAEARGPRQVELDVVVHGLSPTFNPIW